MRDKIPSEIIQLALSDASYEGCGVSITPTLINFFFGNNATIYPLFYDPYHEINP